MGADSAEWYLLVANGSNYILYLYLYLYLIHSVCEVDMTGLRDESCIAAYP